MPAHHSLKPHLAGGVLSLAAVTFGLVYMGSHSLPEAHAGQGEKKEALPKYLGVGSCARCHEKPGPRDKTDWVTLTEFETWDKKDKHSKAFKVLSEERSKRIGTLLNIPDVSKDDRCLNCHAANVPKEQRDESYLIEDGVSCDACHGAAEKWATPHTLAAWRMTPMAQKEALGFNDVRDPVKRAQLCFSCHIGDSAKNRVVTHAMYAAGHPPLPGVEIATFSDEMPRHWRYMKEKVEKTKDILSKVKDAYHIAPDEQEKTKLAVVTSAVGLKAQMDLLAGETAKAASGADTWPDFAQLDCYACHHDLRTVSWRQKRGYLGTPGRPQVRAWPLGLIEVAIRHASDGNDAVAKARSTSLEQLRGELQAVFNARPFGEAKLATPAAMNLSKWAGDLIKDLDKKKYDAATAKRLLRDLCAIPKEAYPDYDSARQIAWAFRVIYGELEQKPSTDAQIKAKLSELDQKLKLQLPSGTGKKILDELKEGLKILADYDPEDFKKLMAELGKLLPE